MIIRYFWNKAVCSFKKGKFYYRPWRQLFQIIRLEIKCILLTGFTLKEINENINNR